MAVTKWNGGASTTAQVSTMTLNNNFNDSETDITVTLTAEDASTTQTVSITPAGTDESVIAAALQAALAASTQSLFAAVTWSVLTTVVTGTAKIAGVPFYFGSAVTGGTGTITDATGTANSGPNDWNTAGNWSGGSVPISADDVLANGSTYSILFGLNQSAVALSSLRIGPTMLGTVGDTANGYELTIDATSLLIEAGRSAVRVHGDTTDTIITQTAPGDDAVVLGGAHSTLVIAGPLVVGGVRLKASSSSSTLTFNNTASSARLVAGASTTATNLRFGSGSAEWSGGNITNLDLFAGTFIQKGTGAQTTVEVFGGTYDCRSSGTIASLAIVGGVVTFVNSEVASVTITNANLTLGTLDLRSGLNNVTLSNNVIVKAGDVFSDRGQTVNPKV